MDWLTQAFPNCSPSTVQKVVNVCKGNYVEAHKKLKQGEGLYFGEHAASYAPAVSKTGRLFETLPELTADVNAVHRSLLPALPRLPFVMELFKQLSFPRSENTAEITAESWMFVVDQVLNVEKPIEHKTTAYFLTSLTDFIAEQQPQGSVPKYLNIRRIIEAYKFENWIPEIIELPESGYEIDCDICCETVHPREITVCTGAELHNVCYSCAKGWAGEQIDKGETKMKCVHKNTCTGFYSDTEAGLFLNVEKYAKLERQRFNMEKFEEDSGWYECPLGCKFTGIVDNIEQFKFFTCPGCGQQICMSCKRKKHTPLSCADYQSDPKAAAINMVAEAMHEASIRKCNKCGQKFNKEGDNQCNQITCLKCGNIQCYICSKTVPKDHTHFRRFGGKGTCDLYDDPGLVAQVARAKQTAVQNLVGAGIGVQDSDLRHL